MKLCPILLAGASLIAGQAYGQSSEIDSREAARDSATADSNDAKADRTTTDNDSVIDSSAVEETTTFDMKEKKNITVEFEPGSDRLSESAKSDIRSMLGAQDSKLERIAIAVWADQRISEEGGAELPEESQDLASRRIDNLEDFIDTLDVEADVDSYNMAQKVGWFSDLFNTDQAAVKKRTTNSESLDGEREADNSDDDKQMQASLASVFSDNGGASKAIIVAIPEDAKSVAH